YVSFLEGLFMRSLQAIGLAGVLLVLLSGQIAGQDKKAEPPKLKASSVVLENTFNAVTRIHFSNVPVHKVSPDPNPPTRCVRYDLNYWLMHAKYYDRSELSIGNPELVEFVRKVGAKNLPASQPTTLPVMAYGIAKAVLEQYPIIQKVEVHLTHFSKGLEVM